MTLTFNGTSQYLTIPYRSSMDGFTALTAMGWAYMTSTSSMQTLISRQRMGAGGTAEWFNLNFYNMNARWLIETTAGTGAATSAATSVINTWYHLCGTWNGTTGAMVLYVNGVSVATGTRAGVQTADTTAIHIGLNPNGTNVVTPAEYMSGQLEDIRVYDREPTAGEVMTIYTLKGNDHIVDGLFCRYVLDEQNTGTATGTIYDIGPSALNAAPTASPTYTVGRLTTRRATLGRR